MATVYQAIGSMARLDNITLDRRGYRPGLFAVSGINSTGPWAAATMAPTTSESPADCHTHRTDPGSSSSSKLLRSTIFDNTCMENNVYKLEQVASMKDCIYCRSYVLKDLGLMDETSRPPESFWKKRHSRDISGVKMRRSGDAAASQSISGTETHKSGDEASRSFFLSFLLSDFLRLFRLYCNNSFEFFASSDRFLPKKHCPNFSFRKCNSSQRISQSLPSGVDSFGGVFRLLCVFVVVFLAFLPLFAHSVVSLDVPDCSGDNASCTCFNITEYTCNCIVAGFNVTITNLNLTDDCNATVCCGATPDDNSTCTNTSSLKTVCTCLPGYEGQDCLKINHCENITCVNGATCREENATFNFTCQCSPGWTGRLCDEVSVDVCNVTSPCMNNATCTNLPDGGYNCSCSLGYEGAQCQTSNCSLVLCQHGGNCTVAEDGRWSCQCDSNFEGAVCEIPLPCASERCKNGGTCSSNATDFICFCPPGYNGTDCSMEVDQCGRLQPCLNGATCVNEPDAYYCTCLPGYTGVNCSTEISECSSDPCNSGTCVDQVNAFVCQCSSNFTGETCATFIPCASDPCNNGGTCINDTLTGYQCDCTPGWQGTTCNTVVGSGAPIALIIGLVVGLFVLILLIILVVVLIIYLKKKRATAGTYRPSKQELDGSRLDFGNILKKPPEERLI